MTIANIAVYPTTAHLHQEALKLANQLNLPLVMTAEQAYDYLLMLTPDYLGLKKCGSNTLPLIVNFQSKRMQSRLLHISLKKEALPRALGLNKLSRPEIIDATGGLARDSFILAAFGFEILLLERSK